MVCALFHGIPYTSAQYIYNSCGYTTPRVRSFPRLTGSVWIHLGLHLTHGEPVTRVVTNLGLKKTLNMDAMQRATLCIVLVLIITRQPAQIAICKSVADWCTLNSSGYGLLFEFRRDQFSFSKHGLVLKFQVRSQEAQNSVWDVDNQEITHACEK